MSFEYTRPKEQDVYNAQSIESFEKVIGEFESGKITFLESNWESPRVFMGAPNGWCEYSNIGGNLLTIKFSNEPTNENETPYTFYILLEAFKKGTHDILFYSKDERKNEIKIRFINLK